VAADGTTELGNNDGVYFRLSDDNQLGGTTADVRNVIAGNRRFNVIATGGSGNKIQGNYIGVDSLGEDGVYFSFASLAVLNNSDILIGGLEPGAGNVISGTANGILLYGGNAARDTVIQGNLIGTSADGKHAVGNGSGILIAGAGDGTGSTSNKVFDTTIGGLDPAARNVISGNTTGISIIGENALGTRIQGNYIGTDIDGQFAIPNTEQGIRVQDASGVVIGGTDVGAGNLISGNTGSGISIEGSAPDTKFQTFYSSLAWQSGWIGHENTSNRDSFYSNIYLPSLPGEPFKAGGQFARASTELDETFDPVSYYADPHLGGTLTLDDSIHANGELIITNPQEWNQNIHIGFFDRSDAEANLLSNAIGLVALEPDSRQGSNGIRVAAYISLASGPEMLGSWVNAPDGLLPDVLYTWRYDYDPVGGTAGAGALDLEVFADGFSIGTSRIELTAEQRETGAGFDAFGLRNGGYPARSNNPNTVNVYTDNVTYTRAVGNTIQGNFIGTKPDGIGLLANAGGIVVTSSSGNVIGGAAGAAGNLILGNTGNGITVGGGSDNTIQNNVVSANGGYGVLLNVSAGNQVHDNRIGTNPAGDAVMPNFIGLSIQDSGGNLVEGNTISGNSERGVYLSGATSPGNSFIANHIGVGTDGTTAVPNGTGVLISGAPENAFIGNVISGNSGVGVSIGSAMATANVFEENLIGVAADGTTARGNNSHGIVISSGAHGNRIGVVGLDPDLDLVGNTIAFNVGDGVRITGADASGNSIRGNSIYSNGGLGIDLAGDSVTENDHQDPDLGPHGLQNFAEIDSAVYNVGLGTTRIVVSLDSMADSDFTVDLYAVAAPDEPWMHGEGRRWLGAFRQSTNRRGGFSYSLDVGAVAEGEYITATTTDVFGNTSEFSPAVEVNTRGGGPISGGPGNGGGNPNALLSSALYNLSASSGGSEVVADDTTSQLVTNTSDGDLLLTATNQFFATFDEDTPDRDFELEYHIDDSALVEGIVEAEFSMASVLESDFAELGGEMPVGKH
jgi:parallel beta-helix repeat protein